MGFKKFMDAIIITLNALVIITHIMRLTYLMFKPHLLTRIRFITIPPSKSQLALYYLLTILVCMTVINNKYKSSLKTGQVLIRL